MRTKIRTKLGTVLESEMYSYHNRVTLIKVKILNDIKQPIKPGMHICNVKDDQTRVDFKLERRLMFCSNCHIIVHSEDYCPKENQKSLGPNIKNPYGPWLISKEYGKRIMDQKENKNSSNPMKSTQLWGI